MCESIFTYCNTHIHQNNLMIYLLDEEDGEWEVHSISENIYNSNFLRGELKIDRGNYKKCKFEYFGLEIKMERNVLYQVKHIVKYIYKGGIFHRSSKMDLVEEMVIPDYCKGRRVFDKDGEWEIESCSEE